MTCKLVRLGPDEVSGVRAEAIDVLDLIDWDHPTDRWLDLDEPAWMGLLAAFEAHDRGDSLTAAFLPGKPLFDESDGRDMIMLAEPALVRSVADALDAFDPAEVSPPPRRRWRRQPRIDLDDLAPDLDELRNCYRRAAADGEAIAVVIG